MKTLHTPTPWITRKNDQRLCARGTEHLFSIVKFRQQGEDSVYLTIAENVVNEDSDFIVRAVNSHNELLDALKLAKATIERLKPPVAYDSTQGTRDVIDQAIAKAEEV